MSEPLQYLNKPLDEDGEILNGLLRKWPEGSAWRTELIKFLEEEKRKNPANQKLAEQKDAEERERWK